jgi:hypothetical protein
MGQHHDKKSYDLCFENIMESPSLMFWNKKPGTILNSTLRDSINTCHIKRITLETMAKKFSNIKCQREEITMLSDVTSHLPHSFKLAPSDLHLSGPLKNARQTI